MDQKYVAQIINKWFINNIEIEKSNWNILKKWFINIFTKNINFLSEINYINFISYLLKTKEFKKTVQQPSVILSTNEQKGKEVIFYKVTVYPVKFDDNSVNKNYQIVRKHNGTIFVKTPLETHVFIGKEKMNPIFEPNLHKYFLKLLKLKNLLHNKPSKSHVINFLTNEQFLCIKNFKK